MTNLVLPTGPTNRPLLALVGEAPGREEVECGAPFVGAAGRLLTQMLKATGIDRKACYITNISQVRPDRNDFGTYYKDKRRNEPTRELVVNWQALRHELTEVNPKVIVALGAEPLRALTDERSLSDFRGTMIDRAGFRVLATYHPAYILRAYGDRPIVEADLTKAHRQAKEPYRPRTQFSINPPFHEVLARLNERPKRIVVDLETFGSPPTTRCIGIAWSKYEAMSIPFVLDGDHRWAEDEEVAILTALKALLLDPYVEKVFQNHPFDVGVLEREFGLAVDPVGIDTMFAFHLLQAGLKRKSLDFLCSIYTDHPVYWHYNAARDDELATYNCMDCIVTYEVAGKIEEELKERNLEKFYTEHTHPAIGAVTRMGHRGIRVDLKAREVLKLQTEWEMAQITKKLEPQTLPNFNPSSTAQVATLLYQLWGLPKQKSLKTHKVTTEDTALQYLGRKYPERKELIDLILDYRKKRTLLSTFIEVPLKNGRSYTSFNVAGTVTGRLSSSKTIEGYGGNLQNILRGTFRRTFIADEGKVLIKADLKQAEYRYLIWVARIDRIIEKYRKDPDFSIHWWNAVVNIWRVPREEITPEMYSKTKNGTYGANYGIGPLKVSRMYNMPTQEAKFIIERYHENVPEVREVFQREIREALKSTRRLTNPLGRERIFYGRLDEELFRAAYSWVCQSLVADVLLAALVELDELGEEILLQVHDELVLQCDEDKVPETAQRIRSAMEREIKVPGVQTPLVIPCEIKVGKNWYDMKELK